jgi:acyl-CoA thioester hydrolase
MDFATDFPAPFVSSAMKVEDQWIDYNGHFNMAYYNVLFDRAADEMFAVLGLGPAYVKERNCSFFTLEAHLTYKRELRAGDIVVISNRILACDAKRVHYVQSMCHKSEDWLSCVSEVIVAHVDLAAKKTSHFPSDVFKCIELAAKSHEHLPIPKEVGHKIGIPQKN